MVLSPKKLGSLFLVCALSGALVAGPTGGKSSLSDSDIETAEAKMTLEKVLAENAHLKDEAQRLQEKLTLQQATTARLTESIALANSESEIFRRQAGELKLRLEALGI